MTSSSLPASWEYLMKKRERAARYIRESDPSLADSNTIDSQAKLVLNHCIKENYVTFDDLEYREALSAYTIPYTQRPQLLKLLAAAKRGEFDVLVISEVRALSRHQVEVFVIYDMLQKCGVRLETVQEKFSDDAIGQFVLSARALVAQLERENTYMRTQRGRADRVANGAMNGHPKPAYGLSFVDGEREQKSSYIFNHSVIYTDADGDKWTEHRIRILMVSLFKHGESLYAIANYLNEKGVPPPKKPKHGVPMWWPSAVHKILSNPIIAGQVYANKYKQEGTKSSMRPKEEWILLPAGTAPALISLEEHQAILVQLAINKQEALRNNTAPKEELGLLRAGFCRCAVCGSSMFVSHYKDSRRPQYICNGRATKCVAHNTMIRVDILDAEALMKIREVLLNPVIVRKKVAKKRADNTLEVDTVSVNNTIAMIKKKMKNLFDLASDATDQETIDDLKAVMKDYERQKMDAEKLLYDVQEDAEERAEIEAEIVRFEKWVEEVRERLTNPEFNPTYDELRLAVRVLGIVAYVYPANGNYPFRADIDATVPEIMKKMSSIPNESF